MKLFAFLSAAVFFAAAARGQAIVEYSIATAASSAAAAGGAKNAGGAIGGIFGNLSQILNQAAKSNGEGTKAIRDTGTIVLPVTRQSAKPVAASKPVNPSDIVDGLGRAELIERFGPPLVSTIDTSNSQLVERMWYPGTSSTEVEIKLTAGKVVSVQPSADRQQEAKK